MLTTTKRSEQPARAPGRTAAPAVRGPRVSRTTSGRYRAPQPRPTDRPRSDVARPASTLAAGVAVVAILLVLALSAHAGLPGAAARTPAPLAEPGLLALVPLVWGAVALVGAWLLARPRQRRSAAAAGREATAESASPVLAPQP
jgi:hypothetical protein